MEDSPTIRIAKTEVRVQTAGIAILATIAIGATIKWLGPVLVPFVLAVFFVCGITPIISFFQKFLSVSRLIAAAITFLLGIILLFLFWVLIWLSVASLIDQAPSYRTRLGELVDRGTQMLPMDRLGFLETEKQEQTDGKKMPTAEQAQHWPLITNRKCPEWTVAWTEPKP